MAPFFARRILPSLCASCRLDPPWLEIWREFFKSKLSLNGLLLQTPLQGCILNLRFIFCPPPFLIYIFSPKWNKLYWGGARRRWKCSFFCNFVNFKSIGEKVCILFSVYQLGEKYAFPPLFSSPFNHFFPQYVIWTPAPLDTLVADMLFK